MEKKNRIFAMFFSFAFLAISTNASPSIPAVFAFGDSTLDAGNNNGIATLFRADHRPYGRDFPGHIPSGRFCNGRLTMDYLVSKLGIKKLLPAYLDPTLTDDDLTTGASFASAGSGLDHVTTAFTRVLDMKKQLRNFDEAVKRIERAVGREKSKELLRDALFVVSVGTNDVIFSLYGLSQTNDVHQRASKYHDFLLRKLNSFIQSLYDRGARTFGVAGLPPVGCLPLQITTFTAMPSEQTPNRGCVKQQNTDSQAYNVKLQALVSSLKTSLSSSKIVYLDIFDPMMDMINNPDKYGFEKTLQGCCGTGFVEMGPLCNDKMPTCSDASKYIFWDAMHPTEAAYLAISNQSLLFLL